MAALAKVTGIDVARRFAGGYCVIVTTDAIADDIVVIDRAVWHVQPFGGEFLMASVTAVGATDVRCALAAGVNTIMTADTITGESAVVDRHG